MQKLLLVLLSAVTFSTTLAQSPNKVSVANNIALTGSASDHITLDALSYVTIVIQEAGKNQVIKTTLSQEDGSFTITDLPNQEYQLILSYVGYKTKIINLPRASSAVVNLGIIQLVPMATQLQEVQIVTQRPIIERDTDKLTYNVESDPESNILHTLDMLRKVPFLTVDANDNLLLNGSTSYQILVNGKRSSLFAATPSDVLKLLPASSVRKVEVITNPSAKYEAAGVGGVINIVTHKSRISGYNGSLNLGASTPAGYSANAYTNATAGKLNLMGQASIRSTNSPKSNNYFLREDKTGQNRLIQVGESDSKSSAQTASAELGYELDTRSTLSASYSINRSNSTQEAVQQTEQRNRKYQLTQAYRNLNNGESSGKGNDVALDYQRSFQRHEQQLLSVTLNLLQSKYNNATALTLLPLLNYTGRKSVSNVADALKEYNVQADYVHPIGKQTLEAGIKSIFEENSSAYYYKNQAPETGAFILDPTLSNSYGYHQQIHAAYLSVNLTRKKWDLRTGIRAEETNLKADFKSSGTSIAARYRNVFPNLSLSFKSGDFTMLRLSYNQRIQRPDLFSLNPFIDLSDPLNISFGNPDLEPALSHSFQLEYSTFIKKTSINALASHNLTNNTIESYTVMGADKVARTTFANTGSYKNFGFTVNANTTYLKKVSISLNTSAHYTIFTNSLEAGQQRNEGLSYTLRGAGSYNAGKGWRTSGNLSYNSANVFLQGKSNGYFWSSIAVSKEFLKDRKASVHLSVRSPFRKERQRRTELETDAFYQIRETNAPLRQLDVSFSYRFGKLR